MFNRLILVVMGAQLVACNRGKISLGAGPEKDARLISDVFTWNCTSDGGTTIYQGVYAQIITLEYAPDALEDIELPSEGGCAYDTTMFPDDAGAGAAELEGVDAPTWSTDTDGGTLESMGTGYWMDDVFEDYYGCQETSTLLSGGTTLDDAGALSGATSPDGTDMPDVTIDGEFEAGIPFGTAVTAAWDSHDWDEAWVQIRRERGGEAYESVTCNASGATEFEVGDDVWGLLNEDLSVDVNNLYVGFQRTDEAEMDDGQRIELLTRAVAVVVVDDP